MNTKRLAALAPLAVSVGVVTAMSLAAPAQAEPGNEDFLSALANHGLAGVIDPGTATAIGQSVCPILAERGQNTADAAAKVADATGMSLGPATMFTGLAISMYCPSVVSDLSQGKLPADVPVVSSILGR